MNCVRRFILFGKSFLPLSVQHSRHYVNLQGKAGTVLSLLRLGRTGQLGGRGTFERKGYSVRDDGAVEGESHAPAFCPACLCVHAHRGDNVVFQRSISGDAPQLERKELLSSSTGAGYRLSTSRWFLRTNATISAREFTPSLVYTRRR
jgi:hypothetical protein